MEPLFTRQSFIPNIRGMYFTYTHTIVTSSQTQIRVRFGEGSTEISSSSCPAKTKAVPRKLGEETQVASRQHRLEGSCCFLPIVRTQKMCGHCPVVNLMNQDKISPSLSDEMSSRSFFVSSCRNCWNLGVSGKGRGKGERLISPLPSPFTQQW